MMKKIYAGILLVSMLAQSIFGMEERKSDSMHTVVRSPEEQKKLNKELRDAVREEDLDRVEELINQGADVNASWASGEVTPLSFACCNNNIALVKLLVLHADVNAKDINRRTCLHSACSYHSIEVVKILLAHKDIQVNVVDDRGQTPLHKACRLDRSDTAKLLLKSFIKPAVSWQQARLIWIGHLKEEANCNLAKLPAEIICHILSFCDIKRNNIESLKRFICHKDAFHWGAFLSANWLNPDLKKELGHILDPQAWQDDETAKNTYDALVKLLQEDEEKQSNQNGLQQE